MDSKSKHTTVKRYCETLTEALGSKDAHELYSISRSLWSCLSVPWLSPVVPLTQRFSPKFLPMRSDKELVTLKSHLPIRDSSLSPWVTLLPLLCTHSAFTGLFLLLVLSFHPCSGLTAHPAASPPCSGQFAEALHRSSLTLIKTLQEKPFFSKKAFRHYKYSGFIYNIG